MSKFKQKLFSIYCEDFCLIESTRNTPLRSFIKTLGLDWTVLSRKEIDKIAVSKRYKQWKLGQKTQKIVKNFGQQQLRETYKPSIRSKHYKHLDPTQVSQKKLIASLVSSGWSPSSSHIRTARKQTKFGLARPTVGKKAYTFRKGYLTFTQPLTGKKVGKTKEIRILKRKKQNKGKYSKDLFSDYNCDYSKTIMEKNTNSKIEKLVNKNKKIKNKLIDNDKFRIVKTLTANKNTDVIEINPTV